MRTIRDPFFDLFRFQPLLWNESERPQQEAKGSLRPTYETWNDAGDLKMEVALPGVRAEDLDLTVKDNTLSVKATRKRVHQTAEGEETVAEFNYERHFSIPETVDAGSIDAHLEDGLLLLTLPAKAETRPQKIQVKAAPRLTD